MAAGDEEVFPAGSPLQAYLAEACPDLPPSIVPKITMAPQAPRTVSHRRKKGLIGGPDVDLYIQFAVQRSLGRLQCLLPSADPCAGMGATAPAPAEWTLHAVPRFGLLCFGCLAFAAFCLYTKDYLTAIPVTAVLILVVLYEGQLRLVKKLQAELFELVQNSVALSRSLQQFALFVQELHLVSMGQRITSEAKEAQPIPWLLAERGECSRLCRLALCELDDLLACTSSSVENQPEAVAVSELKGLSRQVTMKCSKLLEKYDREIQQRGGNLVLRRGQFLVWLPLKLRSCSSAIFENNAKIGEILASVQAARQPVPSSNPKRSGSEHFLTGSLERVHEIQMRLQLMRQLCRLQDENELSSHYGAVAAELESLRQGWDLGSQLFCKARPDPSLNVPPSGSHPVPVEPQVLPASESVALDEIDRMQAARSAPVSVFEAEPESTLQQTSQVQYSLPDAPRRVIGLPPPVPRERQFVRLPAPEQEAADSPQVTPSPQGAVLAELSGVLRKRKQVALAEPVT